MMQEHPLNTNETNKVNNIRGETGERRKTVGTD